MLIKAKVNLRVRHTLYVCRRSILFFFFFFFTSDSLISNRHRRLRDCINTTILYVSVCDLSTLSTHSTFFQTSHTVHIKYVCVCVRKKQYIMCPVTRSKNVFAANEYFYFSNINRSSTIDLNEKLFDLRNETNTRTPPAQVDQFL